jgi:IS5 family transposase
VTADRGYGEAAVEKDLHELGVRTVVIPRKGRPGKARQAREHRPAFRRTVKWRTGSEARISTLKRQYGWDRSRLDDLDGARIKTGVRGGTCTIYTLSAATLLESGGVRHAAAGRLTRAGRGEKCH